MMELVSNYSMYSPRGWSVSSYILCHEYAVMNAVYTLDLACLVNSPFFATAVILALWLIDTYRPPQANKGGSAPRNGKRKAISANIGKLHNPSIYLYPTAQF